MSFLRKLFGGNSEAAGSNDNQDLQKTFDILKYDGVKALKYGQHDYAIMCFEKALEMREDPEVRDYLYRAYAQCERWNEAIRQLEVLADLQPENAQIRISQAQLAFLAEDYTLLCNVCQRALSQHENNDEIHFWRAKGLSGQGETEEAITALTRAIALNPDNYEAYLMRAQLCFKHNQTAMADADTDLLLSHVSKAEDIHLLKADIECKKGNWQEALYHLDIITGLNPFAVDAYRRKVFVRTQLGDIAGAKEDEAYLDEISSHDNQDPINTQDVVDKLEDRYKQNNPFA